MTIEELIRSRRPLAPATAPEINALAETGSLQEAQLVQVQLDVIRSVAWLLFDCRGALQVVAANTAVVIAHGIRNLSWDGDPRGPRTWWSVLGWEPTLSANSWSVHAMFAPQALLTMDASSAEFLAGNVASPNTAPPDYLTADEETLDRGTPHWFSQMDLVYSTRTGLPGS